VCVSYGAEDNLISGKQGQDIISASGNITVQDSWFTKYINNTESNYFSVERSDIQVKLWFDDALKRHYSTSWALSISYDIILTNKNGVESTLTNQELILKYHTDVNYQDINLKIYDDDIYIKARVENIHVGSGNTLPNSIIPEDIHLDVEINSTKYFKLDDTEQTLVDHNIIYVSQTNELELLWDYVEGAESYDLEWLYIDVPEGDLVTYDQVFTFKNATRINLLNTNYKLSLAYPRGVFIFRVRPIGKEVIATGVKRIEGTWSLSTIGSLSQVSNPERFNWTGLLTDMNWQYQASFSEEGKRVESLGFYDGSLKPRQNMVINNAENTVILNEPIYDYLGRETLKLLPSVEVSQGLKFYSNRTQMSTGVHYNYTNFDVASKVDTPDNMIGLGVNSYYSSNPSIGVDNDYIADAEGYPFSRTIIDNDGTGRVKKQSMFGKTTIGSSNMNSNQLMTYLYGTPTQEELYRLFGNEVGNVSHYKKNAVIDQNGQATVSYIDMNGRVIATGLAGDSPTNLETIDSYPDSFDNIISDLTPNNILNNSGVLELNKSIVVLFPTLHSFQYSLLADNILHPCTDTPTEFRYDIEIRVLNEDNIIQPINYQGSQVNGIELTNITNETLITFNVFLGVGTFKIQKTVSLNESSMQTLQDEFATNMATCLIFPVSTTGSPCNPSCEDICFSEYGYIDDLQTKFYQTSNGDDVASVDVQQNLTYFGNYGASDLQIIFNAISACEAECGQGVEFPEDGAIDECTIKLNALLSDMSPGGQYFDNLPLASQNSASNDWLINHSGTVPNVIDANATNWDYIRDNWVDSYVNSLLTYHPEYCIYVANCGEFSYKKSPPETFVPDVTCSGSFSGISVANYNAIASNIDYNVVVGSPEEYLFNPMNYLTSVATTTALDKENYQPYVDNLVDSQQDPYMACRLYIHNEMKQKLTKYLDANLNGSEYHSIWYVLDNPLQIHLGAAGYPQVTVDFYQTLYGNGTDPGLIGLGSNQITKYQFFKNAYLYNKNLVNYTAISNVTDIVSPSQCASPNSSGTFSFLTSGINPGVTPTGFIIHYSENPVFQNANNANIDQYILTEISDQCLSTCEQNMNTIIGNMSDCASAANLAIMKSYFVSICTLGCDVNTPYGSSITATPVSGPWGPMSSFEEVVNHYNTTISPSSSCIIPEYPPSISGVLDENCSCNLMTDFVESFYISENISIPSTYNLASQLSTQQEIDLVEALEEILTAVDPYSSVSVGQMQLWLTNCENNVEVTNFPASFQCSLPPIVDYTNFEEECGEAYDALQSYNNSEAYQYELAKAWDLFITDYKGKAWETINTRETFNMIYELKEYHYTLFYYDQAENLIKTVPPAGIYRVIDGATPNFSTTLNQTEIENCKNHVISPSTNPYIHPNHEQITNYKYNSLQQLMESSTPDGGFSKFWYDELGRLIVSQNDSQLADDEYSYTVFDPLGRTVEVGEIKNTTVMTYNLAKNGQDYYNWLNSVISEKKEVLKTHYGEYATNFNEFGTVDVHSLRNRIGSVTYTKVAIPNSTDYDFATHYNYDYLGNVKSLINENNDIPIIANSRFKRLDYTYDLVSGNVIKVDYQKNQIDEFYYKYEYDANNRLTVSYTSLDNKIWQKESKNFYYAHGPLKRKEIGDKIVQANDYVYTLNGWLKSVNSSVHDYNRDAGRDGKVSTNNEFVGRDVYGYSLHYYDNDYTAVNSLEADNLLVDLNNPLLSNVQTSQNLFNGNIQAMAVSLSGLDENPLKMNVNAYKYDQLQRIKKSTTFVDEIDSDEVRINNELISSAADGGYDASYSYDGNGNLQHLMRKSGHIGQSVNLVMDDFTYVYDATKINQLTQIKEPNLLASNEDNDLDGNEQGGNNYQYNSIGQLTKDISEDISSIEWTVNGKVKRIIFDETLNSNKTTNLHSIEFEYDPMGMRLSKKVLIALTDFTQTFYTYDASSNLISTYEYTKRGTIETYKLVDNIIYADKRLGTVDRNIDLLDIIPNEGKYVRTLGNKKYEMSDHRGNVMEVITDRVLSNDIVGNGFTDYYNADVISYSDYYPFGMLLPNRHESSNEYRYGFQGQEKDDEIKGEGNSLNYKYRMHDTRIGRFFAVDPLTSEYPHYTPYSFSGNKVIAFRELEGLEEFYSADGSHLGTVGNSTQKRVVNDDAVFEFYKAAESIAMSAESTVAKYLSSSLLNFAENGLLLNSAPILTGENTVNNIIKNWYSKVKLNGGKSESAMKIFSQEFTNSNGSKFIGYIEGSTMNDNSKREVGVAYSNVKINGIYIAGRKKTYIGGSYTPSERNYESNFVVHSAVHTHPRNYSKMSPEDHAHALSGGFDMYMIEYGTGVLDKFDYKVYNENTSFNFNKSLETGWVFDNSAVRKASTYDVETLNE